MSKQARRTPPPPVGKHRPQTRSRLALSATAALVAIAAVIVAVVIGTHSSSPKLPPPATPDAADRSASPALVAAANAVGFHPTYEPGFGTIENKPASAAESPTNPDLLAAGGRAPGFTLKTPQGQKVSLSQYHGKAVLLEFFATWCPHCNAEAPHLRKLYASLPKNETIVSVNADGETAPSVFAFHRYYGLDYPALVDPSAHPGSFNTQGEAGPVTTSYRVVDFPTFYVINPQGRIVWRSDGEQPDALLRDELATAAKS